MDLYLSEEPTPAAIEALFADDRRLVLADDWISAPAAPDARVVVLARNASEFPWGLSFREGHDDPEAWLLDAARDLSVTLGCRTLYTGSPLEGARPWHSIVFDAGKAYLADDTDSTLAGDGDDPVKILRRVEELDAR